MQLSLPLVPKCPKCKVTMSYVYDRKLWGDKSYHLYQCPCCNQFACVGKEEDNVLEQGSTSRKVS